MIGTKSILEKVLEINQSTSEIKISTIEDGIRIEGNMISFGTFGDYISFMV